MKKVLLSVVAVFALTGMAYANEAAAPEAAVVVEETVEAVAVEANGTVEAVAEEAAEVVPETPAPEATAE